MWWLPHAPSGVTNCTCQPCPQYISWHLGSVWSCNASISYFYTLSKYTNYSNIKHSYNKCGPLLGPMCTLMRPLVRPNQFGWSSKTLDPRILHLLFILKYGGPPFSHQILLVPTQKRYYHLEKPLFKLGSNIESRNKGVFRPCISWNIMITKQLNSMMHDIVSCVLHHWQCYQASIDWWNMWLVQDG
jgi:hypothetical protein